MKNKSNGIANFTHWMLNIVLLMLVGLVGNWAMELKGRVETLENSQVTLSQLQWENRRIRQDICRVENAIGRLREVITKEPSFYTACETIR